jgi:NADPH2:quinone reductase
MRAIEISQFGAPSVLRLTDRPVPDLLPGEVLVRVAAAGINRPDILQRQGKYPAPAGVTDIPGLEIAGEIVAGSAQAVGLRLGQQVCALVPGGAYAEFCAVPAALCLPVPAGWSLLEAASLPETLFTVWSNVFERAHIQPGESLLVQGGTSGIGVMAIQLATALGHRVWATAGTEIKVRACERLGAVRGIHYRCEDFVAIVKDMTQGRGVDVILDMVGGDYIARELDCLAEEGRLVLIALLRGARTEINLMPFLLRRLSLTGATLRGRSIPYKAAIARQLQQRVWPMLESRVIQPVIDQIFPLEQAQKAHELMESGTHIGKIMLKLDTI